jgi:hypothetical protein
VPTKLVKVKNALNAVYPANKNQPLKSGWFLFKTSRWWSGALFLFYFVLLDVHI